MQYDIEKKAYYNFCNMRHSGKFKGQRLGQAFYDHFKLHKLSDQDSLKNLYELEGKDAQQLISKLFRMV